MGTLLGNKHCVEYLWFNFLVILGKLSWFALEFLLPLLRKTKQNKKTSLKSRF